MSINKLVICLELAVLGLVLIVLLLSSFDYHGGGGEKKETAEQAGQVHIAEHEKKKAEAKYPALLTDVHVAPRQREIWFGDLDGMLKRGQVRVLIPFSRTFFFRADGQEMGLSTEILRLYKKFLNEQMALGEKKMGFVFLPTPQDQLIQELAAGKGDIAVTDIGPVPDQEEDVTSVSPVAAEIQEILVTGPDARLFKSIFNLSGQTITICEDSPYTASLQKLNSTLVSIGRKPVTLRFVDAFLDDADLLEMTAAGLLPMTVVDSHIGKFWAQVFHKLKLHNKIVLRTAKEISWVIRSDNRLLQESISYFRKNSYLPQDGYPVLTSYYRKKDHFLQNNLRLSELERYHRFAPFFEKYGQEYAFPPLLLAALAYQESELDFARDSVRHDENNKIGIMGLDPSALLQEGLEADLTKIQGAEENIRTAARYLDFLREHYFSAPELSESDRNMMALAAYRIGPMQVMAARKKAALAGYNPDIWFKQVETAIQSEEGRNIDDISQYVRNIYSYFKAYEYVLEKSGNESRQE